MISTDNDLIILFSKNCEGTVIWSSDGSNKNKPAYYSPVWMMKFFIDYNEPITLQNL